MIVSAASRMVSAISFGVLRRWAPSTRPIMRSMNDSPGLVVISTMIRSDSTVVPPVTEERSPPDSRITGADSPVIADSSTVAMPSTMSPSPGMTSPASTSTRSPIRSSVPGTSSVTSGVAASSWPGASPPTSRRAIVSRLVRRSDSACALPRSSATASARLANSTVNHSQIAISQANRAGPPVMVSRMASAVTSTDPTQTTNITGLRSWVRGSSLRSAAGSAATSCRGEKAPEEIRRPVRSARRCCASRIRVSGSVIVMRVPPQTGRGRAPGRTSTRRPARSCRRPGPRTAARWCATCLRRPPPVAARRARRPARARPGSG